MDKLITNFHQDGAFQLALYKQNTIRLLVVFAIAFSLATIPGSLANNFRLPTIPTARALPGLNNPWLPAGPAADRMTTPIFTDSIAEFNNLQQGLPPGSGSSIDLADQQLLPNLTTPLNVSSGFLLTPTIKEHGYYEIEFLLTNTFWNCNFNFGNSTCGIHIRQGISHLIDKQAFVTVDPHILSTAVAIDNPVPIDNGGLTTPNACSWDLLYTQTGANCIVGSTDPTSPQYTGGTAYRLAPALTGPNGAQPNPSLDFCASAGHFIAAGVATGVKTPPTVAAGVWWQQQPSAWTISTSTNCVLTGVTVGTIPSFYIRLDDPKRLDLGNTLASQICLLFTGSSATPCADLSVFQGNLAGFPGFTTSPTVLQNNWWIYTANFIGVYPYDSSLYFTYSSQFVSGFPSIQGRICSTRSVGTFSAPNYIYLCDNNYDTISTQMEFANCPGGAPPAGTPTPAFTICPTNFGGGLSAQSSAYKAEDRFGSRAYTIPVFNTIDQFAYLNNGFVRVINGNLGGMANTNGVGIANYYTWLNAWNSASSTIRQGLSQPVRSVSPYTAETPQDYYILGNVLDKLGRVNPYAPNQLINWMTISTNLICNPTPPAIPCGTALTYPPPSGTVATYRFTLRNDLFFHDGKQVTSFDVAFSYLSLLASGAFQSAGANPVVGITLLSLQQFDLNVNAFGPTTLIYLMGLSIMSGRYWTSVGPSAWDTAFQTCAMNLNSMTQNCFSAQYSVNFGLIGANGLPTVVCNIGKNLTNCPFSPSNMNVDAAKIVPTYDPVASGTLIGSGPWMCVSSTGVRGQGCTATGMQNPPANTAGYTLTRFGTGHAPGSTLTDNYFRSSGTAALWFWSGNTGDFGHDFLNFGVVINCVNAPVGKIGCTQWQQGIGGEVNGSPTVVSAIPQASIVIRFVGVDFVSVAADVLSGQMPITPAPWNQAAIPMIAVGPANSFDGFPAPVLYEGAQTLNPASIVTCAQGYPVGGYDC